MPIMDNKPAKGKVKKDISPMQQQSANGATKKGTKSTHAVSRAPTVEGVDMQKGIVQRPSQS